MRSIRGPLLIVATLAVVVGLIAFAALQSGERRAAVVAETQREAEAERGAAAAKASESLQAPDVAPIERAAAEAPVAEQVDANEPRLEVQVLDETGAAVADAMLAIFRGEELLAQGTTDAEGLASFAARDGTGECAVRSGGWDALRAELDLAAGRRTLSLAASAQVAGTLLLDGAPLAEPLELTWRPNERRPSESQLPKAVLKAFNTNKRAMSMSVKSRPDGTFRFGGLAPRPLGTISWEKPYVVEGSRNEFEGRHVPVIAPRSDLVLKLVAALEVRLRVVDSTGAPIPKARVSLGRQAGSRRSSMGTSADAEGRLAMTFAPDPFDKLVATVSLPDGSGPNEHEFPPPAVLHGVWDLGDLAPAETREISVLVQDLQGAPIAGAQAIPWPDEHVRSDVKTDATGRMKVRVRAKNQEIAVEAFEFVTARFPVPPDAAEVVAQLRGTCVLEFVVPGLAAKDHGLTVELRGPPTLFIDADDEEPETVKSIGRGWSSSSDGESTTIDAEPEESGRWRIAGLAPGNVLHAALKSGGKRMSEVEIAPLRDGEHRTVELPLDDTGQTVRVRVLSPEGQPLGNSSVFVLDPGRSWTYRSQQANLLGVVELKVYGDRSTVCARAPGFAPKSVLVRLPVAGGTVDIRLDPPRSVEIELVDPGGALFTGRAENRVDNGGPGLQRGATKEQDGRWRIEGLPEGEVVIEVTTPPQGKMSQIHDTRVPFARFVVGEPGFVGTTVDLAEAPPEARYRVALATAGSIGDLTFSHVLEEHGGSPGFSGLAAGSYDVWLERMSDDSLDSWLRVGSAVRAVIDAEHQRVSVEVSPAR